MNPAPAGAATSGVGPQRTAEIAARVERFVREVVVPYEQDPRRDHHGAPTDALVSELQEKARAAGVLTPHILPDGAHLTQRETAYRAAQVRPVAARPARLQHHRARRGQHVPARQGRERQHSRSASSSRWSRQRALGVLHDRTGRRGRRRLRSVDDEDHLPARRQPLGDQRAQDLHHRCGWARVGIVMAKSDDGACMFLVDLPDPAIRIERRAQHDRQLDARRPRDGDDRRTCAYPPTRCSARAAKASSTRRSASRPRACRTACAGWAPAPARRKSRPTMPTAARPSASC